MDLGWPQVLTIVAANLVLMMGMLGTYVGLYLHNDKKIETNRKELRDAMNENRKETNEILRSIQAEMKDFHERLLLIEAERDN